MAKLFWAWFTAVVRERHALTEVARQDFRSRYLGSRLGMVWAFVNPAVQIGIYWLIFAVGFRTHAIGGVPYVAWLTAGIVPWFFMAEIINASTTAITGHRYLVNKVAFRVSMLPVIKVTNAMVIHGIFLIIMLAITSAFGFYPDVYDLQILYYIAAGVTLSVGIGWITSSVNVYMRDVEQAVQILIQLLFDVTPIFWSITMIPGRWQWLLELNPFFYVTQGYRDAVLYRQWFWNNPSQSVYFWCVAVAVFVVGGMVFHRLRASFADML